LTEDDPSDGPENGPAQGEPGVKVSEPPIELAPALAEGPGGIATPGEEFRLRAERAEDRLAEVLAAYRQVRSENEGFRERITRNIERRFDHRRERLLLKFIDILDNLDRALEATEQSYAGTPLIEGLILVRTQLLQTLQEEGLERIPVLGLPYDPNFSEAVATQPVDDPDHHHVVVKELLRGYRLNGRVARASRVVVGERGPAPAADGDALVVVGEPPEPPEGSLEDIIARAAAADSFGGARRAEPEPAPEPGAGAEKEAPAETQPRHSKRRP
jgi:molecular chaperone GrpE